jgi:16S rRNA C967 or C1407 C5-methylase (RsmB/RsmF family)
MARDLTKTVNLRLRLPEGLRLKLANEAEKAKRSLNSEVLFRLTRTFGPEWERLVAAAEERQKREQRQIEEIMEDPKVKARLSEIVAELWEQRRKK